MIFFQILTAPHIPGSWGIAEFAGAVLGEPAFEFNGAVVGLDLKGGAGGVVIGTKRVEKRVICIDDSLKPRTEINDEDFSAGIDRGFGVIEIDGWHVLMHRYKKNVLGSKINITESHPLRQA